MFDTRVFSFSVFSDQNSINVVVRGLVSSDRAAGSDVGEEVECSAEGQVEGDMALANWCLKQIRSCWKLAELYSYSKRSLQRNLISLDTLNRLW
jgi:hypothetical protein